jgi:hypothetical protein
MIIFFIFSEQQFFIWCIQWREVTKKELWPAQSNFNKIATKNSKKFVRYRIFFQGSTFAAAVIGVAYYSIFGGEDED